MKISQIRRKADLSLIVRKRLPSFLKKEKINLRKSNTNNNNNDINDINFNKKKVKYNQIPQFVQAIIKFTKKNKGWCDEDDVINKNKIIYFNNLLSEIPKHKASLTSALIHEIYRCLYKLNYIKIDVIFTLFSILTNNTLDFSNLSGYVNCDFKELINITKYLYHFQNICNTNIQSILYNNENFKLIKTVERYLREHAKNENSFNRNTCCSSVIYNHIYNYILKFDNPDNIDILLYSLIKGKYANTAKQNVKHEKDLALPSDNFLKKLGTASPEGDNFIYEKNNLLKKHENDSVCISSLNEGNSHDKLNKNREENEWIYYPHMNHPNMDSSRTNCANTNSSHKDDNKELLIEYISNFYKINDMFNYLLNKVVIYFNENAHIFDFYNLKLLFFFLGKFQKYDLNLLEKISSRIMDEIEKMKVNPKLLNNDHLTEENKKYNYANNRIKKLRKKYLNTYMKIDSKEFLIIPYTIGISMNIYFNNYLIEYVNIYILSLINSRVNCDMENFIYSLIGYKYIMLRFFILYNICLFKEKSIKNEKILHKYNLFIRKLIKNAEGTANTYTTHRLNVIGEQIQNSHINNINSINNISNINSINSINNINNINSTNNIDNYHYYFPNTSNNKEVRDFIPTNVGDDISNRGTCLDKYDYAKNKENMLHEKSNHIHDNKIEYNYLNKIDDKKNQGEYAIVSPDYVFNLLLNEFQMNIENIHLVNFDENFIYEKYSSVQLQNFYFYYKKLFDKVYNYAIFLLSKYDINDKLRIYKNLRSLSLSDQIINDIYIEVLYEKIVLNSNRNIMNASTTLKYINNS
ncbi:hypothetical protein MKS88_002332 [Plasmodium brasilianum]|uniref:Uncharacterized protein n=3 Tax=Plasmodium (Plasmodium) TaxID=418103 RepID=A0A1D3PAE4_PLAMA|nr:conserved Plasmodium protein, unknown function [Plasmodium malariae]KAI4838823.1 hypothetical protein MKS88_002332 [Plasmodium brasilianum]SCN12163.1 conserved Plasmodium protein, unknown function [Plasmodium malariae]